MSEALEATILGIVRRAGPRGITMGRIVDRIVADGGDERAAEALIWSFIESRSLTPHGFSCRTLRKPSPNGAGATYRSYEFVLIEWSPDKDRQMDLPIDDDGSRPSGTHGGSDRSEPH